MTRVRRSVQLILISFAVVPLLAVIGTFVALGFFLPERQPQPVSELSNDFPVLGFWSNTDGEHCEVFEHGELSEYDFISLEVPKSGNQICAESFERFRESGVWPETRRRRFPGLVNYGLEHLDGGLVEVSVWHARHDEADAHSIYEVREGSSSLLNPRARYRTVTSEGIYAAFVFMVVFAIALLLYLAVAIAMILRVPLAEAPRASRANGA